jgi:hypothetical protein
MRERLEEVEVSIIVWLLRNVVIHRKVTRVSVLSHERIANANKTL